MPFQDSNCGTGDQRLGDNRNRFSADSCRAIAVTIERNCVPKVPRKLCNVPCKLLTNLPRHCVNLAIWRGVTASVSKVPTLVNHGPFPGGKPTSVCVETARTDTIAIHSWPMVLTSFFHFFSKVVAIPGFPFPATLRRHSRQN